MRRELIYVVVVAAVMIAAGPPLRGEQGTAPQSAGAQAPGTPAAGARGAGAPTVPAPIAPPKPFVPEGFTPLFNGESLAGWHVSKTNHHGTTPDYHVLHGLIVATQSPLGRGGILLTDKKYKNVEVYMEVKPDYGCDSGLFFRSNEAGDAYQVTMDYLPGGSIGGIYGEGLEGVGARATARFPAAGGPAARGAAAGATGTAVPAAPARGGAAPAASEGGRGNLLGTPPGQSE